MSSFRKVAPRSTHRERSQLKARENLGLLEKKKDYKLRAIDYHKKTEHIKKLNNKARDKNPDEFYLKMQNMINVKNSLSNNTKIPEKERKNILKQNLTYINFQKQLNVKKIEKVKILPLFTGNHKRFSKLSNETVTIEPLPNDNNNDNPTFQILKLERYKHLKLVKSRLDRIEKLSVESSILTVQNQITKKGRKKKLGVDVRGVPVYKWKGFRQR
jgi:hypothetical protein